MTTGMTLGAKCGAASRPPSTSAFNELGTNLAPTPEERRGQLAATQRQSSRRAIHRSHDAHSEDEQGRPYYEVLMPLQGCSIGPPRAPGTARPTRRPAHEDTRRGDTWGRRRCCTRGHVPFGSSGHVGGTIGAMIAQEGGVRGHGLPAVLDQFAGSRSGAKFGSTSASFAVCTGQREVTVRTPSRWAGRPVVGSGMSDWSGSPSRRRAGDLPRPVAETRAICPHSRAPSAATPEKLE
jgi:hypothetical protein